MPSAPDRPALRERFEQRKEAVVARACELFAERGYDGTGMEDISRASGLAVGGIYHYVGAKEDLLSEILRQLMDPLLDRAAEIEAGAEPAAERLHGLVRLWVDHVARHRDHMLVFNQERHVLERHPDRWSEATAARRRFEEILGSVLAAAAEEAGSTRAGADLEIVELALLGMVNHSAQWLRLPGRLTPEQIADGYWEIMMAALDEAPSTHRAPRAG